MGSVEAGASSWLSPANYSPPTHPPPCKTHSNLIFGHNLDESESEILFLVKHTLIWVFRKNRDESEIEIILLVKHSLYADFWTL